jgi:hypothetical protein
MKAAAAVGLLTLGAGLLGGCQSTQDKNAELAASLGPVKQEEGLEIDETSRDVEALDTTLLTDQYGSAAAVLLRNNSEETLVDVPIGLNVLDAKGNSIFKNDLPGLEGPLVSMPLLRPGETTYWVHDEVLADDGESAKVTIGASKKTLEEELPEVEVEQPEIQIDPTSGVQADGIVINNSDETIPEVLFYGVAVDGDEVVAAGRGAVEELKPGRRRHYDIFFIGDPREGELTVTHFINLDAE